jgi:hypothetical protein
MSSSTEYATVWVHWVKYYDSNEDFDNAKNFKKNMTVFDEHVNEYIEEGWQPHGSPQFSAGWFKGCTMSGSVVQAVIRETYYEEEEEEGEDEEEEDEEVEDEEEEEEGEVRDQVRRSGRISNRN